MSYSSTLAVVASVATSLFQPASPPEEGWADDILIAVLWAAIAAALLTAMLILLLTD